MKTFKYILIFLLIIPLFLACEEDEGGDNEPERTTVTVTLKNEGGALGCSSQAEQVTFIVSYRDIQVDATINSGTFGVINVLVEDGESINVVVQRTSDNTVLANSNVNVRTESRPFNDTAPGRKITYCDTFDLIFSDF